MFRKTTGTILCPSCGSLTTADAPACLICGRRQPGMWGFAGPLQALFRWFNFTDVVTAACALLFVAALALDARSLLEPRGLFRLFSPSGAALWMLGAGGAIPLQLGRWWTLLTAMYLHAGVLHILFNLLWIRQLGPAVQEVYGPARLTVIFTASGALGSLVSALTGHAFSVGASGAVFGLLGALVAYGRKRGGTFGGLVLRQYGQWALVLFVFGFLMPGVDNAAHAGGFAGGFASGLLLGLAERRREGGLDHVLAAGAVTLTLVAFALALWAAVAR